MADDLDRAKDVEMQFRELSIDKTINGSQFPKQKLDENGRIVCLDCGDLLPQQRLDIEPKAARCVPCKEALENKQKHLSGHPARPRYQAIRGQDN